MTILGWSSSSAAYDPSGSKALYLSSGKYHMWYPNQKTPATEWEARIDALIKLPNKPGSQTTHCAMRVQAFYPMNFHCSLAIRRMVMQALKTNGEMFMFQKRGLFFGTLMKYGRVEQP